MMKKILIYLLAVLSVLFLTACQNPRQQEPYTGHDALLSERNALAAENKALREELEKLAPPEEQPKTAFIEGYFTACVRNVIPDYVFDASTPCVAVITSFQSSPYTVYLGHELAAQTEPGKIYRFYIQKTEVDLTRFSDPDILLTPENALPLLYLRIASISPAVQDDYGLNCNQLRFTE